MSHVQRIKQVKASLRVSAITTMLSVVDSLAGTCAVPHRSRRSERISVNQRQLRWQSWCRLLREVPTIRVLPGAIDFNKYMNACGQGGNWAKALALLRVMPSLRIKPSHVSYNTAIRACEL